MTDEYQKEKIKDGLVIGGIGGLTSFFIYENKNVALLSVLITGSFVYYKHDAINPFLIRIKKSYDPDWWITNWDGKRLPMPVYHLKDQEPDPIKNYAVDTGDVLKWGAILTTAGPTAGLSLLFA